MTFEEAQRELEQIVQQLETGQADLDERDQALGTRRGALPPLRRTSWTRRRARSRNWPAGWRLCARRNVLRIRPMADRNSTQLLKQVPLFSDLDNKELEQVAQSMKRRRFSAGQEIAREGESGVGFFVIEDGNAKVTVHGEERAGSGPGDYFGEIALIAQGARTATVTAESDLTAYGMTFWEFRPLVEGNAIDRLEAAPGARQDVRPGRAPLTARGARPARRDPRAPARDRR